MTFRIVSYNILVPVFGENPEGYPKCQPKYLATNYRWNMIQIQLEQEIVQHKNTIICLQELSLTLLGEVELFFRRMNYSLFHHLYGSRRMDYMGVGIAIPISMQLNLIRYINIGDHIHSIGKVREEKNSLSTSISSTGESATDNSVKSTSDPWTTAMDRANTLTCIQVIIDSKPVYIGTYHMPNKYKDHDVMAIHSSLVKDLMFELAAGKEFILAGDFNFEPFTTWYKALTDKEYSCSNVPKSIKYDIPYQPNTEQKLKSAYKEKNGMDPVYTVCVDLPSVPNYHNTVDYIFFYGHLTVENVLELPDQPASDSYPDEKHPSDHLMIAATFKFV